MARYAGLVAHSCGLACNTRTSEMADEPPNTNPEYLAPKTPLPRLSGQGSIIHLQDNTAFQEGGSDTSALLRSLI